MQNSKVIVAINKDPGAPVFEFSDLAVVGDVHTVVPQARRAPAGPQGRVMARPADFPPPFQADRFVARADRPGGRPASRSASSWSGPGPPGLACAIRFGQLLEEDPEIAERLGEVPLAILEKGKQPGSHLLSGAVVNPRSLRQLFGRVPAGIDDIPTYGRCPASPSTCSPDGGRSRSRLRRPCAIAATSSSRCRSSGAGWPNGPRRPVPWSCPRRRRQALLVSDGRVVGVRTGDKGRGADGEELGELRTRHATSWPR